MENSIVITSKDGRLQAEIEPDYGGMVSALKIEGIDVLFLDEKKILSSPVASGGIPILFPFAGKTLNDRYEVDGKVYYMPMHGFLKNRTFAVKRVESDCAELWIKNDQAVMDRNYPFEFKFFIFYQITNESLLIKTEIYNNSKKTLIHSLGWHPYYRVTDLASVKLKHHMKTRYDYFVCKDLDAETTININQPLDNVYCNPILNMYQFDNPKDGYSVECVMDKSYKSIVVYNGTSGSVCIEPWCGIPNTANNRRFIDEIQPNCSKEYSLQFKLKKV